MHISRYCAPKKPFYADKLRNSAKADKFMSPAVVQCQEIHANTTLGLGTSDSKSLSRLGPKIQSAITVSSL
jgi:hypothetical protein